METHYAVCILSALHIARQYWHTSVALRPTQIGTGGVPGACTRAPPFTPNPRYPDFIATNTPPKEHGTLCTMLLIQDMQVCEFP